MVKAIGFQKELKEVAKKIRNKWIRNNILMILMQYFDVKKTSHSEN